MAVMVIQDVEATIEEYDQVNEKIQPEKDPPKGLIVHCGAKPSGGKIHVVDIWDSAEDFQAFFESRLGPAVQEVMGPPPEDAGPPPEPTILDVHDLVKP